MAERDEHGGVTQVADKEPILKIEDLPKMSIEELEAELNKVRARAAAPMANRMR